MTRIRYSVIAGAVGFFGGVFFKDEFSLKIPEIFAALPAISTTDPRNVPTASQLEIPPAYSICKRKNFILSYDHRTKVPNLVLEHLTLNNIQNNPGVTRSKNEFFEDSTIHPFFRSRNEDYKQSCYERGHLAASGNYRFSQESVDDTFVLSNVAPQVGEGFNRGAWKKLEDHTLHLLKQYKDIRVYSGPLYLAKYGCDGKKYVTYEVIGDNNVAVPTHFFKVIIGQTENHELDMEAYILPNTSIEKYYGVKSFAVPCEAIERASGFLISKEFPPTAFRQINGNILKPAKQLG